MDPLGAEVTTAVVVVVVGTPTEEKALGSIADTDVALFDGIDDVGTPKENPGGSLEAPVEPPCSITDADVAVAFFDEADDALAAPPLSALPKENP